MDTFQGTLALRYGNVEMRGEVLRFRKGWYSVKHAQRAVARMYLKLSHGILSAHKSEGASPSVIVTMCGCRVFVSEGHHTVTVVDPHEHSGWSSHLLRGALREHTRSSISFDSDEWSLWYDALHEAANKRIEDYYELLEEIGRGSFASVRRARDRKTGEFVAVKVLQKDTKSWRRVSVREMNIIQHVDHPNVVTTIDLFDTHQTLYLVMELMTGGKLFSVLTCAKGFTERTCAAVMADIFDGVAYLHRHNIVHRDIKPDNILCRSSRRPFGCKLADFGLAAYFSETHVERGQTNRLLSSAVGTPFYVAPEVLRRRHYGPAVDLWSCGVLMYLMLSGRLPFNGRDRHELFVNIVFNEPTFPDERWGDFSDATRDLVRGLLQRDPDLRLSAVEARQHAWFRSDLSPMLLDERLRSPDVQRAIQKPKALMSGSPAVVLADSVKPSMETDSDDLEGPDAPSSHTD